MATPITETRTAFSALKAFFEGLSSYALSGGTSPDPSTLSSSMKYEELLSFSTSQAERASGFEVGSSQEAIATCYCTERELGMATQRKTSIYNSLSGELGEEATFYSQAGDFYAGVIAGSPTGGSQC